MPWCEECAKYWTPNSMNDDGTCPRCGEVVSEQSGGPHVHLDQPRPTGDAVPAQDEKAPWHFKLMVVAVVVYLGWRFIAIFT